MDGLFSNVLAAQAVGTSTSVTLQGKGFITLKHDAPVEGGGSPVTLVNVNNTIAGDGTIGGAGLKLNNKTGGLIEANGSGSVLAIDTGANAVVNAGTMSAAINSTLFIGSKQGFACRSSSRHRQSPLRVANHRRTKSQRPPPL